MDLTNTPGVFGKITPASQEVQASGDGLVFKEHSVSQVLKQPEGFTVPSPGGNIPPTGVPDSEGGNVNTSIKQWLTLLESVIPEVTNPGQPVASVTSRLAAGYYASQWLNRPLANAMRMPQPDFPLAENLPDVVVRNGQSKARPGNGTERKASFHPLMSTSPAGNSPTPHQPTVYTILMVMPTVFREQTGRNLLQGDDTVTAQNPPVVNTGTELFHTVPGSFDPGMVQSEASPVLPRFPKSGTETNNSPLRGNGSSEAMPGVVQATFSSVSRGHAPPFRVSTASMGGFTGEVAEIIHQNSRQLAGLPPGETRQILIRLQPRHLGLLRIRLRLEKDGLKGKIETSSQEATRLIQVNMKQLIERLHNLGIHVQDFDVSFQQQFAAPNNLYKEWQENGKRKNSTKINEGDVMTMEKEGTANRIENNSLVDLMM